MARRRKRGCAFAQAVNLPGVSVFRLEIIVRAAGDEGVQEPFYVL
jgi:hypothetical protein